MKKEILKRLLAEFAYVGDEKISGKTAIQIVNAVFDEFSIPKAVEKAQKYINDCHADLGFMGSPEYDKQKKILDDYFKPLEQKAKDDKEKADYHRLKEKYGHA